MLPGGDDSKVRHVQKPIQADAKRHYEWTKLRGVAAWRK